MVNGWMECSEQLPLFLGNSKERKEWLYSCQMARLFLQVFAGACEAGWASIVGDIRWKKQEMEDRLQQTSPDLIIADEKLKSLFQNVQTKVIYSNEIEDWMCLKSDVPESDDNVPFYIGFTSGSTGKPKAFFRSHDSWVESFRCNEVDLGMTEKDHVLIPGSFVNSTFLYGALSTLFLGGTIYVLKKFSPARFMDVLQHYPISHVYVVPTMLNALLKEGYPYISSYYFYFDRCKVASANEGENAPTVSKRSIC